MTVKNNLDRIHQAFICERNRWNASDKIQQTTCTAFVVVNISATLTSFLGDVSVAQLVASMFGVVLGGVVKVVRSNLARGKMFTAFIGSVDLLHICSYKSDK